MKKYRLKWKNLILLLLVLIFFVTLIISLINVFIWFKNNKNNQNEIKSIYDISQIRKNEDNESTLTIENDNIDKSNYYWSYIKMKLIDVDLKELKKINSETIGWIQVKGTNINYPVVQHANNDYYLNHSFEKKQNEAGWVFLDYRNNLTELDKNTIIYAHARLNNTMFGSLKNILKNDWLTNKDNYIIKLSTEYQNSLWQVFSVYDIPTTNDYIKTYFVDEFEFNDFISLLHSRSFYDFKTTVSQEDNIITLSTCRNNQKKIVMHAKLIKIEKK